ncbi:sugar transferase [Alsobacter sp. KACC 23698]|uniref:Sugar transferase n=1 Tax=Alsobacter sp. KACC 23698 TaxID=3149229 RepID=A0AAU7JIK8_9HYPH
MATSKRANPGGSGSQPLKDSDVRLDCLEDAQLAAKRLLDVVVSCIAIAVLAPVMAGLWVLIRIDSPGPALFRQKRVGKDGRLFVLYKFRTMTHGADEAIHRSAIRRFLRNERLSSDPGAPFKLNDDPRLTRMGPWIRRTSLDETPQFFNVLFGDMSLVGPRPAIPYELEHFEAWHHARHAVKPGITGIWQVYGRGRVSCDEMMRMDVEYARTWTILSDLKLIALTAPAVLRGNGAH